MSRSGYVDYDGGDEHDHLRAAGWAANVRRCLAGKKGQAFLWELYLALEALPERALIIGAIEDQQGTCCSLGAVARYRGIDVPKKFIATDDDEIDQYEFAEAMGPLFGIKDLLAREIMFENDEADNWHWPDGTVCHGVPWAQRDTPIRREDTPEERWQRMRCWVVSRLRGTP